MVLNRFQMAAVKRTAQNTKKLVAKRAKINAQMHDLAAELININDQIETWEAPIKTMTGGYTSEQCIAYEGNLPEAKETEEEVPSDVNTETVEF